MMGITKRCGLFVGLFALFLTASSSVFSANVSAASDFDNTLRTTDTLILSGEDYYNPAWNLDCEPEDFSLNWSTAIFDHSNSAIADSFSNAIDNGDWAVTFDNQGFGASQINVYWTERETLEADFILESGYDYLRLSSIDEIHSIRLMQKKFTTMNSGDGCELVGDSYNSNTLGNINITGNPLAVSSLVYLFTGTVNYPAGYEGEEVPDTGVGQVEPDQFLYPQYEWKIANKKLNVKYIGNIPHFLTGINTIVIEKWAFNWETGTNEIIETILENPAGWTNSEYDLTTDGAGYYTVRITHNQQLDSPPWEENADELYYIAPIFIRINWDGSSNRAGTTAGCAERNAVCGDVKEGEGGQSNPLFGMFSALSNLELHGLTNFLLAPINFIGTLPSKVSSCTPISYPLFGTTQTLPCLRPMYEQYAVIYGLWQTIINGVVIGLVSMNIFRVVKNINTPTQDGIEVARL